MTARRAWLILGAEGLAVGLVCAGLVVAGPRLYSRYRRRRGW